MQIHLGNNVTLSTHLTIHANSKNTIDNNKGIDGGSIMNASNATLTNETFTNNICFYVNAGSDEYHATLKLAIQKRDACRSRYARIEPCGHENAAVYMDNVEGIYTTMDCPNSASIGS
ncbi:MAG: hypothetical protein J6P83_01985 [Bacteroidales bacterium]|nr:hypothetical protein [Bacteroidales bacterium]